jgi:hypothetical protein
MASAKIHAYLSKKKTGAVSVELNAGGDIYLDHADLKVGGVKASSAGLVILADQNFETKQSQFSVRANGDAHLSLSTFGNVEAYRNKFSSRSALGEASVHVYGRDGVDLERSTASADTHYTQISTLQVESGVGSVLASYGKISADEVLLGANDTLDMSDARITSGAIQIETCNTYEGQGACNNPVVNLNLSNRLKTGDSLCIDGESYSDVNNVDLQYGAQIARGMSCTLP